MNKEHILKKRNTHTQVKSQEEIQPYIFMEQEQDDKMMILSYNTDLMHVKFCNYYNTHTHSFSSNDSIIDFMLCFVL